jgi:tetratricopeptide (TPR) repeat protein
MGSRIVSNAYLARIALWRGELEAAETYARAAAVHGFIREWMLVGIVLSVQGRPHEALEWARRAPGFLLSTKLLRGVSQTGREWLVDEETIDRNADASSLAECGHVYLELNVPERAERCFALSEGLAHGPAEAQRALHLSETDAPAALLALQPVLKTSIHADVLVAMAFIQHRLGKDAEALPWIERALDVSPGHNGAYAALLDVCGKLGDAGCAATRQRLGFPSPDGGTTAADAGSR